MTVHHYTKAPDGSPVTGGLVRYVALDQQQPPIERSMDGGGYSDMSGVRANVVYLHVVQANGYQMVTEYVTVAALDPGSPEPTVVVTLSPSFRQPTRDRVCAVNGAFQGLTYRGFLPQFAPFCYSLATIAERTDWRTQERADKRTHCYRALSYNYANDNGFTYSLPGMDFTNNLTGLKQLLAEDLQFGLSPVLYLAGDGQSYSADGGTYGHRWLMDHMASIVAALKDPAINNFDFTKVGVFCHGFELITNGGWSPVDFETAVIQLRSLIPDGFIMSHIGTYTWWGDGDPGHPRGPVGDWASLAGQAIDVCFDEGDAPFVDEHGNSLGNTNADGWQQRAIAHLGPAANLDFIDQKNRVAYEWPQPPEQQTPRGRRYAVAGELDEFRWTRSAVSLGEITRERTYCRSLGFSLVG